MAFKKLIVLINILLITIITLTVSIWFIGLLLQFPFSTKKLLKSDKLKKADLIVFVSGNNKRSKYALKLLKQGYFTHLFSPGGEPNIKTILQKFNNINSNNNLTFNYYKNSDSTFEDAINTKKYIKGKNITNILLVTSPYHSYRAKWIFKKILPKINIISATVPIKESSFNPDHLKNKKSISYRLARLEQLKFIFYYILHGWR